MATIYDTDSNIERCEICDLQNLEENMIQRFDSEGEYFVCEDCEVKDITNSLAEKLEADIKE